MAATEDLVGFVGEALARGLPRADIRDALIRAGWDEARVQQALAAFADIAFPVPVPRPRPSLSARDAFLYLVLFSTLYISAYNLGRLLFTFIEIAFPDPAAPAGLPDGSRDAIRWAVASLIVAFPVFAYLARLTERAMRRDPGERHSKVRRWLTYWTLFVAATVLLGDVIALIYSLLGGELTIRFVLKVLTVGAIAGIVFGYYLRDLRTDEKEPA